jgi:hypothetical protein
MAFPLIPQPKPEHHKIAKHKKRAAIQGDRRDDKAKAKARDGHRCRWPKFDHDTPNHVCIGPLESAHKVAIGMGGDKTGERTHKRDLMTCCRFIHQDSPDALERHGRSWEGLTDEQADGPVIFSRRVQQPDGSWAWVEIARERRIGMLEHV